MRWIRFIAAAVLIICMISGVFTLEASAREAGVQIDVEQIGRKTWSLPVGESHHWFIRAVIPGQWRDITIVQTLSPALTLDAASFCLSLLQENGEQILLRMQEHYMVTAGSVFTEDGTADRFLMSLTPDGISFLSEYGCGDWELVVSYSAKISNSAVIGEQIIGIAQLNLENAEGKRYIFLSDKAVVCTGGIHILLTDPEGKPCQGGKFMLARQATEEEMNNETVTKELLDTGEETIAVVYTVFFTDAWLDTQKTDTAVTDETGHALIYGLPFGTYYLVQTEASRPDALTSKPVKVHINEASHLTEADNWKDTHGRIVDNTVPIVQSQLVMPRTGGPGTAPYTFTGTVLILCACLLLWYNRKGSLCR